MLKQPKYHLTDNNLEIEIKLGLSGGLARVRKTLKNAGFQVAKRRVLENNVVFDTADLKLRAARELLRLRRTGESSTLTYKGPPLDGKHKSREEVESIIADPDRLELIFTRLGYSVVFRYEKFRTEYSIPDQEGTVTLDETPIGNFMELEGQPDWIDETAVLLGHSSSDFITKSYATLYQEYCHERDIAPTDMVFENLPS